MRYNSKISIGNHEISADNPTYFIADIGANHDGDFERAKSLVKLCAEAGADAVKFQHFKAESIVSDRGFRELDKDFLAHQSSWKKTVFEVYKEASIDISWDYELKHLCDDCGVDYMTTPYAPNFVEHVDPLVAAYKIGSGDITWTQHIQHIASKGKPVILACGASTIEDVIRAVETVVELNPNIAVLQCNTNYSGSDENFDYINLNVIHTLKTMFPGICVGLSDHTTGHATAVAGVAIGCRIIEKHFTDDNSREGPDHKFAMNPKSWRLMVDTAREVERSLGKPIKKIEKNEEKTVVIQRRSIRAKKNLIKGSKLEVEDVTMLRPCPIGALEPWRLTDLIGKTLKQNVSMGEHLSLQHFV